MGWILVGVVVVLGVIAFSGAKSSKRESGAADPAATTRSELAARGFAASEILQPKR
ncbi:MAG: hypothetical protein ABJD07_09020 [Gemmatimonadaceae bacterium]